VNALAIAAVIAAKRETHPELARPMTWPGFNRICDREGVAIRPAPLAMPRPAQLVPFLGTWSILLSADAPRRRLLYLASHELGHLWCHHDAAHERWERVFNMDPHWNDDPREDDAELFAQLLVMGPTRARPYVLPDPAELMGEEAETPLQAALRALRREQSG
jgi:hypothetical protein